MARIGAQWLLAKARPRHLEPVRDPPPSSAPPPGVDYPDIQFHFLPLAVRYDGTVGGARATASRRMSGRCARPRAARSGSTSADPTAPPAIRFNYMADEQDWIDFRRCIRLTREIFAQPAFAPYAGDEIQPGADVQSDDELDGFVREHAESAYHPCGTARLGRRDDPLAVVDPECRVIGVERPARRRQLDLPAHHQRQPQRARRSWSARRPPTTSSAARRCRRSNAEPWINPRWRTSRPLSTPEADNPADR